MGKFHLDWERWVAEDLIDEIVLIAEHRRAGYHDWETHSRPQFVEARRRGKRVYIWCATEASFDELPPPLSPISGRQNRELFLQTMEIVLGRCLETDADGVFMHEAYYIEEMDYWSTIAKVLRGDNSRTSASQRIA